MSIQQDADGLTSQQQEKLVSLLEDIEAATDAKKAVWYGREDRREIRKIRKTIEDS